MSDDRHGDLLRDASADEIANRAPPKIMRSKGGQSCRLYGTMSMPPEGGGAHVREYLRDNAIGAVLHRAYTLALIGKQARQRSQVREGYGSRPASFRVLRPQPDGLGEALPGILDGDAGRPALAGTSPRQS